MYMQKNAVLMLASHAEMALGMGLQLGLDGVKVPITGVFMDPVYAMDGRKRDQSKFLYSTALENVLIMIFFLACWLI